MCNTSVGTNGLLNLLFLLVVTDSLQGWNGGSEFSGGNA